MNYKIACVMAALLAIVATYQASAQRTAHKPAAKSAAEPVVPQFLKLSQLMTIHKLGTVPKADEYLTAHNWQFVSAKPSDSIDVVSYSHKLPSGTVDGRLMISLCNKLASGVCIKSDIHEGVTRQHIFQIGYQVTQSVYEHLQKDARAVIGATSSRLGENSMVTTYKEKNLKFTFILDKSNESHTVYVILFGDVALEELE